MTEIFSTVVSWLHAAAWGSVGDWVSGVGTVLAVIVALGIARKDWRRSDAERRDAEASQARLIVTSVKHQETGAGRWTDVTVTNHSEYPLPLLRLGSVLARPPHDGGTFSLRGRSPIRQVLEPHGFATWSVEVVDKNAKKVAWPAEFDVFIRFTDHAGREWSRCNLDQPKRQLPDGFLASWRPGASGWSLGQRLRLSKGLRQYIEDGEDKPGPPLGGAGQ
ncbi:hypothetical protein [Actinopolymorpha pittospori]